MRTRGLSASDATMTAVGVFLGRATGPQPNIGSRPTNPRWPPLTQPMCELLHTCLKNFVPPGHEPASIGSEHVLLRRGTRHPSQFLRRLWTCSPHSASGLAVGAANRFDAVTFLKGTSRSKALGLTARSGPRQFQPRDRRKASSQNALFVAQAYDQLGRVDQAIAVLEVGPPQWRSVPAVRFWLGLSYALAGRKKQAAMEF